MKRNDRGAVKILGLRKPICQHVHEIEYEPVHRTVTCEVKRQKDTGAGLIVTDSSTTAMFCSKFIDE